MAIKVNNTEVISDSRGLNNIVSIDATTAATIGAASGGGSTTLLVDQSITSNVNYIQLDFTSGYKRFVIQLRGIVSNSATNGGMEARMTNGSGTILTSNDEYWYRSWNDTTRQRQASFRYLGELSTITSYKGNFNLVIEDPLDSTTQTIFTQYAWGVYQAQSSPYDGTSFGTMDTTGANNGIRFFHQNSSYGATTSFSSNSVGYRMWGIK
jgi:hypothetical protein